jgi:RNA polymerase sigma-70 factor (ECF subfamily)
MTAVDRVRVLLDAAANGDDSATRQLVRLTQHRVAQLCSALGSGDDTDDLLQETYLRAFRSLRNYRGDSAGFVPWLLAIARNVCATEVRRRVRRRAVFNRLMTFRHDSVVSSPAAMLELDELVRGLAIEQREAFVLTQMIGLSYEEAARTCDCPIGTIRSRVARARSALFARLERAQAEA